MKPNWQLFRKGYIVRWRESLWIVTEVVSNGVHMIAFDTESTSAFITEDYYPDNKEINLQSIKWVANNAKDLLKRMVNKFFKEFSGDS